MKRLLLLMFLIGIACSPPALADELLETYFAVLSERDHFNSDGQRLTEAAAIIRQDRANYHRFKKRDFGDTGDVFFSSAKNREILEQLLKRGTSSPGALKSIVNGTPAIAVRIYRTDTGTPYVNVSIHA